MTHDDLTELEQNPGVFEGRLRRSFWLDPLNWMPIVVPVKPPRDPAYVEYRRANRAYRRAFGRGERHRKILLAAGAARAKERDHAS